MFSLLSGLWNYLFSLQNYHVLIIGIDSAGKTTLLENIKHNYGAGGLPSSKITPTIGMNLGKIKYHGAQVVFWDLGGQAKMRAMWEKYYLEANAVLYVVDSANPGRLEEARLAFDHMLEDDCLSHTPLFILANKQDMQGSLPPSDVAEVFRCSPVSAAGTPAASFLTGGSGEKRVFGVSGITSAGLDECLAAVVRECRLHKNRND